MIMKEVQNSIQFQAHLLFFIQDESPGRESILYVLPDQKDSLRLLAIVFSLKLHASAQYLSKLIDVFIKTYPN
jgi:hypothetical protein